MKRDMSQLYSRLGLRPGCTLDEFKHAYLRRIAELHPDHVNGAVGDANALNELVWLYATARRFHRRHGRLPGAQVRATPSPAAYRSVGMVRSEPVQSAGAGQAEHAALIPARSERPLPAATLVLPLVAVLLLILLSGDWLTPTPQPDPGKTSPANEHPSNSLKPGMFETAVLELQGEPSEKRGDRWIYGPSWVQFEDGRVVDWYSAPQHPLMIAVGVLAPGEVMLDPERH